MADGERIKVGPSSLPALFRGAARTPPDDFLAKSARSGRRAPHFFLLLRASAHNDALIPASFALVQLCLCEGNPRLPEVSICCLLSLFYFGKDDGASRPLLKHWLRFLHNWHLLIASPPFESPWCLTKCCTDSRGRPMLSTRFSEPSLVIKPFAF